MLGIQTFGKYLQTYIVLLFIETLYDSSYDNSL